MAKKFVFECVADLPEDEMEAAEAKVAFKPAIKAFVETLDAAGVKHVDTITTRTERATPATPRAARGGRTPAAVQPASPRPVEAAE